MSQGAARGKRMHTVATRVDEDLLQTIDLYQRQRERETRIPLSRGLVVLEILEEWARGRATSGSARARGSG